MKMQTIPAKVGAAAWTRDSRQHPLPAELPDRTPVTVLSLDMPYVLVADDAGKEWKLTHWQIDCGTKYCGPAGNWKHESKPPVLDALERELARHLSNSRPEGYAGAAYDENLSSLRWTLERNGRTVKP